MLLPYVSKTVSYSVDPDQMSRNTLYNQGLHGSTLSQQCLDKSVGIIMPW